jgi:hypothetical protein
MHRPSLSIVSHPPLQSHHTVKTRTVFELDWVLDRLEINSFHRTKGPIKEDRGRPESRKGEKADFLWVEAGVRKLSRKEEEGEETMVIPVERFGVLGGEQ